VDNLEFLGDSNKWKVSFTREAHDWGLMFLLPFSKHFIHLKCVEVAKTSCGGSAPKMVCSRSSPFTPWLAQEEVASLKKCLAHLGSFKGGFHYVVSNAW
jgi:hypothetical protein